MLKKLKLGWLGGNNNVRENVKVQPGSGVAEGFRPVLDATGLLDTHERRRLVRMLRENCPFSENIIEVWWIQPLKELAIRVQDMPAAWAGSFSHPGGFLDLSLNVAVRAVKLVRGMMLPPGAAPEEQAEQSSGWVCAVYWAALFHHLNWLSGVEGRTDKGLPWHPGMAGPAGPWRIRRATGEPSSLNSVYMACRMLPESGILWLQRWPALSEALLAYLCGEKAESGLLNSIISDALSGCGIVAASTEIGDQISGNNKQKHDEISPKLSNDVDNPLSSKAYIGPSSETIGIVENQYDSEQAENAVLVKSEKDVAEIPNFSENSELVTLSSAFENGGGRINEIPAGLYTDISAPLSAEELLDVLDSQMETGSVKDAFQSNSGLSKEIPGPVEESEKSDALSDIHDTESDGTPGQAFLSWLKLSVNNGSLTVNEHDSLLHILAGYTFLVSPDCFYKYISSSPDVTQEKTQLQKSFEDLNVHYLRNGKGLFHYHKYDTADRTGRFTKMSGYMILPGVIFQEGNCPIDSIWLSPKT
ncbi:helicase [Kosakonia radicincitans UMEnt01/12]|uniref:TraI domain-containing protein n=1 Tax=Kosakonia radicincitans TaxID=283686 RepID=UPI000461501A|nr:TraI domain-containing protein [Kosakonia radicincitans]KDE34162.1 helicase [Kosakonia radicincitans UMEnt01/12]